MGYIGTSEYAATVTMSRSQLNEAISVQNSIIVNGIKADNSGALAATLSAVAGTILTLCFKLPVVVSVAGGLITTLFGSIGGFKDSVEKLAQTGLNELIAMKTWMDKNTQYDLVEIEFPFLEFRYDDSSTNWRVVTGKGVAKRVHSGTGWIIL